MCAHPQILTCGYYEPSSEEDLKAHPTRQYIYNDSSRFLPLLGGGREVGFVAFAHRAGKLYRGRNRTGLTPPCYAIPRHFTSVSHVLFQGRFIIAAGFNLRTLDKHHDLLLTQQVSSPVPLGWKGKIAQRIHSHTSKKPSFQWQKLGFTDTQLPLYCETYLLSKLGVTQFKRI